MGHPHKAPTVTPQYMQPRIELGIWFHELLRLATIYGAIVATDAGPSPGGMVMALAYQSAPGEYCTQVASRAGTSQEGAMTLLPCIRRLARQEGVY